MQYFYYGKEELQGQELAEDINHKTETLAESTTRVVVDDDSVYEIDLECIRCQQKDRSGTKH